MKHHSTVWFWELWISLACVPVANPVTCPWLAIIPVFFFGGGGWEEEPNPSHPSMIHHLLSSSKKTLRNTHHQVILCPFFGMVKTWPFQRLLVTSNQGIKRSFWITWTTFCYHIFHVFLEENSQSPEISHAIPSGGLFFSATNSLRSPQMVVKSKGIHPDIFRLGIPDLFFSPDWSTEIDWKSLLKRASFFHPPICTYSTRDKSVPSLIHSTDFSGSNVKGDR